MSNSTAERLERNIPQIINIWGNRANKEIKTTPQEILASRDSLLEYLLQLVSALSNNDKGQWLGTGHGRERACRAYYTIDNLIFEYHILRQVICEVIEKEVVLTSTEREIIVSSIEHAVNKAVTQFSQYRQQIEKISEALKARDEFVSFNSHELKTPITSLQLQLEMILRNILQGKNSATEPEQLKKVFELAIRQTNNLTVLVEDLLRVSMLQ